MVNPDEAKLVGMPTEASTWLMNSMGELRIGKAAFLRFTTEKLEVRLNNVQSRQSIACRDADRSVNMNNLQLTIQFDSLRLEAYYFCVDRCYL